MKTKTATAAVPKSNGSQPTPEVVTLPAPDLRQVEIRLRGTSPQKQMLGKQMKKASVGKEAKNPERDYKDSLYVLPGGGYGFPSIAFKAAAVRAGTYSDLKMTFLRGAFHVLGEMVKIEGKPRMREDMVRLQGMTADIRYRGEFVEWSVRLPVKYNARAITLEQLVNLFAIAGFSVGVGEWRPERDGSYGMFEVRA